MRDPFYKIIYIKGICTILSESQKGKKVKQTKNNSKINF
ncbi:hypothetical protein MC28_F149 (plasmid) [Bacillus thuringiensis MC28]|nr:hypothetical protein MC28_F149 [Bacillus thuringiensis MC28]